MLGIVCVPGTRPSLGKLVFLTIVPESQVVGKHELPEDLLPQLWWSLKRHKLGG